jgi:hypothetical protein
MPSSTLHAFPHASPDQMATMQLARALSQIKSQPCETAIQHTAYLYLGEKKSGNSCLSQAGLLISSDIKRAIAPLALVPKIPQTEIKRKDSWRLPNGRMAACVQQEDYWWIR